MTPSIWWRMTCGPAAVAIRTHLPLDGADGQQQRGGQAPLFRLAPGGGYEAVAQVLHEPVMGADAVHFDPTARRLTVRAAGAAVDGQSLLYLSYLLLEAELQRHGCVTLHASAVARDDRAVLLLGHPGAGKTTTALRLCRDHGCELIGNDLVVVGGPYPALQILAGTTSLRLRHASIARAMPEFLDLFPSTVVDPWRTKIDVAPQALGLRVGVPPVAIGSAVFVRVDGDYPDLLVGPGDTLIHRLNLHENALRYVRGGSTPWLVGPGHRFGPYVPPLDDAAAHRARTVTLERLLARAHYVAGSPAAVTGHISRLLTGSSQPVEHREGPRSGRMP